MGEFFVVRGPAARSGPRGRRRRDAAPRTGVPFQEGPGARVLARAATELVGPAWPEERRPVPDKPHIPPDVWLLLDIA